MTERSSVNRLNSGSSPSHDVKTAQLSTHRSQHVRYSGSSPRRYVVGWDSSAGDRLKLISRSDFGLKSRGECVKFTWRYLGISVGRRCKSRFVPAQEVAESSSQAHQPALEAAIVRRLDLGSISELLPAYLLEHS